ncbi:DUF2096 domain-containing protein [Candidatus Bathyarchaeota archaeon]|nr:DUF2096 domain-containing protein [Candidatus Bathyarchaeota archaeon]
MSYEKKWNILANFLTELKKNGKKIPANVVKDLRSAKTIIQVRKVDPTHRETISRIDKYLRNVESYCIFAAEKLGTDIAEKWLEKLEEIKIDNNKIKQKSPRFIQGIPKNMKWLRVKTSEDTPQEKVKKLVKENNLFYKKQENGYILVYGNEKCFNSFVESMTEQFRGNINS